MLRRFACAVVILWSVSVHGVKLFSSGSCNRAISAPSVVTGTAQCGLKIDLNSPYAAAPGSLRVGFAISEVLPILSIVKVFLPDFNQSPFVFNSGGSSRAVGLVTAGGDEQVSALHGLGIPSMTLESQVGGTLATVRMGEISQPSLADSEAGFQFNITNVQNPYGGSQQANATLSLFTPNGTLVYEENYLLPSIVPGPLTADRASFGLTRPAAGIESDVEVRLKTWGVIPADGRIIVTLPFGFILRSGSTVAQSQLNFGEYNAIYVASSSEVGNNITIFMAGSLGNTRSPLEPHRPESDLKFSFVLTRVRTPFSGLSGTFQIRTVTGGGAVIDEGDSIGGVQVSKGALRNVEISSSDDAARKETQMTFTFGTTGTIPADGKFLIIMPFGYYFPSPELVEYTNLGRTGVPVLEASGLTLTIQLGGGVHNATGSTDLDETDGVSFTISGIINPGAGSTTPYVLRSTFNDATKVIDETQVPGMGISTGMFPSRSVSISETRAGQPNTVAVDFSTTGFIPNDALIRLTVPNGLGLSLPSTTQVVASTCCEAGVCTNPCNITVHSISDTDITLRLPGDGTRNLDEPNSVSIRLNHIRNLWSGNKEGFDLSLLLSDGISTVLQAKDVDGPQLVPGSLRSAEAIFSETLTLSNTYGPALAGRCGTYRVRLEVAGTLPAQAIVRMSFPPRIQLNDVSCIENADPVSRVTFQSTPPDILNLRFDAQRRQATVQIDAQGSDTWDQPNRIEFYLANIRHLSAGALGFLAVETLFPEEPNVPDRLVEHNRSVPLLPVLSPESIAPAATPQILFAGARTSVSVSLSLSGRLPRAGIVQVMLPQAFRINDGDLTAVIDSSIDGGPANMQVIARDVEEGAVKVRIDPAAVGREDGIADSFWQCRPASLNCVRTPPDVAQGMLLMKDTALSFTLSQIRNLAGGYSGDFRIQTLLEDATSVVESKVDVEGAQLVIGNLTDGSVSPKFLGSAIRTRVRVSITIAKTLQASGYVVVTFPDGFQVNDGGPTNVTETWLTRYTSEYSTPSRVVETDEAARSVTISIGGRDDDMLEAMNTFEFTLDKIRNMVARPTPPRTFQLSGTFRLATRLQSGLVVEVFRAAPVPISPNLITAYPVGDADILLESLIEGSAGWIVITYSTASVLPRDAIISLDLPAVYTFNADGNSTLRVTYDDEQDPHYRLSIRPINSFDLLGSVEQQLLTDTQERNLKAQLLYTTVRAHRLMHNASVSVSPRALIRLNITHVRVSDAVGPTGDHNISVLTPDLAVIAKGVIPSVSVGRPSEPRNVRMRNCPANWPDPDPRCLEVEWEPPLDDAGSPITGYRVALDFKSNAFENIVQNIDLIVDAATPLKVQSISLSEGILHYVRVQAANEKGGLQGYGRPAYGEPVRALSLPSEPRPAVLRSDSTNRIFASWLPPQFTGALNPPPQILFYKIELDRNGQTFAAINHNDTLVVAGDRRSVVSGLLRPGTYHARIYAANAAGYGPPVVYPLTALATPIMSVAWDEAVSPAHLAVLPIQAGYQLRQAIQAFDGDITDSVDIVVDPDTGIPVKASLSATVVSGINGGLTNVATKILSMTPDVSQAGLRFKVCFRARNVNIAIPVLGPDVDVVRCIIIHVVDPILSWTDSTDSSPLQTPPEGSQYQTFPGCFVEIPLYANAVWYTTVFGYKTYVQEFNGSFTERPAMDGAELIAPHPQGVVSPDSFVNIANNYSHSAVFRYKPPTSMAGRTLRVCFTASDEWQLASIHRCVTVATGSCKACLQAGQSLAALAAEYSTDWVQVWAVNPRLGSPNSPRAPNTLVNVGVLYESRGGERIPQLAEKFFSSVDRLLTDNPDFVDRAGGYEKAVGRALVPGYRLCILPPLCQVECPGGGQCGVRAANANTLGFVI